MFVELQVVVDFLTAFDPDHFDGAEIYNFIEIYKLLEQSGENAGKISIEKFGKALATNLHV